MAVACAVACALLAPAASASVRELGLPDNFPFPPPDCPQDCQALAQVTGFQVQLGKSHNPLRVKKHGWIVAFSVRVAKPTADQITFFKNTYGAHPTARLAIVRSRKHKRQYKLKRQSQAFDLEQYFGSTPTIALHQALRVHKDDIVALTIPTWLPAFAHNLSSDQAWRNSHSGDDCNSTNPPPAAHQKVDSIMTYGCFFRTARMLYSASFVGDPKVTNPPPEHQR